MRWITSATRSSLKVVIAAGVTLAGSGGVAAASAVRPTSGSAFLLKLGKPKQLATTVPRNGDVNPYGVVVVPQTVGTLVKGDTLVSNFNDKKNVQGTGTTIVEVSPKGTVVTFAKSGHYPLLTPAPEA